MKLDVSGIVKCLDGLKGWSIVFEEVCKSVPKVYELSNGTKLWGIEDSSDFVVATIYPNPIMFVTPLKVLNPDPKSVKMAIHAMLRLNTFFVNCNVKAGI